MEIANFIMWFKNGLKAQKLLAQGVWGKTGFLKLWVKKGRDIKKTCKR